jgi:hypothetical protein
MEAVGRVFINPISKMKALHFNDARVRNAAFTCVTPHSIARPSCLGTFYVSPPPFSSYRLP